MVPDYKPTQKTLFSYITWHVLIRVLAALRLNNSSKRALQSQTKKVTITTSDALEEGPHNGPFPAGAWQYCNGRPKKQNKKKKKMAGNFTVLF